MVGRAVFPREEDIVGNIVEDGGASNGVINLIFLILYPTSEVRDFQVQISLHCVFGAGIRLVVTTRLPFFILWGMFRKGTMRFNLGDRN